ncbi:hypothetical protein SLA2020_404710 [Shorea laevis]
MGFSDPPSFLPLAGVQSIGCCGLFLAVEPNGPMEVTPKDVLVPAFSSNVLQHFWSVLVRSKMFDDVGCHFLILPRPVLSTVARCFPQVLLGMLSDFFRIYLLLWVSFGLMGRLRLG